MHTQEQGRSGRAGGAAQRESTGSAHTLKCWKQNFLQRSTLETLADGAIPLVRKEEATEARDRPRDTLHTV